MAISFIGSAVGSASPNGTFNVTLPNGCQAGDLILVAFAVGDSPGADNDLAVNGFTEVADQAITTDTNDTEMFVGYRYFVGGDTQVPISGNFTALGGTNASNAAVVMVFRGVASAAQGGPFSTASQVATGADSSNADPPQIATVASDCVVIAGASGCSGGTAPAFTAPTNYTTNAVSRGHDDTVDVVVGMAYRLSGFANPENPGAFTAANIGTAANNSWCATTMALKAAPQAFTLALDQGSFSLSGQAVTLKSARLVGAEQGSYSLAGQNVTLKSARVLGIGHGVYALTGQDVTLTFEEASGYPPLAAGQGSFVLTGQAANLLYNRLLMAEQGSYTLAGQAVPLKSARRLVMEFGTFSLSGQNVTLLFDDGIPDAPADFLLKPKWRRRLWLLYDLPSR